MSRNTTVLVLVGIFLCVVACGLATTLQLIESNYWVRFMMTRGDGPGIVAGLALATAIVFGAAILGILLHRDRQK